ncbi:MAG: hypothetical protein P4L90_24770 [Rhodopila sp.]|nr:hypothetical protein [Rhodopila sp.]
MDTHLARAGSAAGWDDWAHAGLEDMPLPNAGDLPYVIKSPFTYQIIHDVIARGNLQFDAVVIPMRDLSEAAASRSIIEIQALHRSNPWMADLEQTWEHIGHTWGGIVYSTSPIDQARLLAVGFHQLLDQLVKADIPVILLSFPRLIEDGEYLYRKLASVLPEAISVDQARLAHAEVADPSKVRVGTEIRGKADGSAQGFTLTGPGRGSLERVALTRILAEARQELVDVRAQLADATTTVQSIQAARDGDMSLLRATEQALADMTEERNHQEALRRSAEQALAEMTEERNHQEGLRRSAEQALGIATEERDRRSSELQAAEQALAAVTTERDEAQSGLGAASSVIARLQERLTCIESATTWRAAQLLQRSASRMPWAKPIARWLFRT